MGKSQFLQIGNIEVPENPFLDLRNSKNEEILVWKGRKAFSTE